MYGLSLTISVKSKTDNDLTTLDARLYPSKRSRFGLNHKGVFSIENDITKASVGTPSRPPFLSKGFSSPATAATQSESPVAPSRPSHRNKAVKLRRERQFHDAAVATSAAGCPIRFKVCLTWHALLTVGEQRDGHCLHLPERERVSRLWRNLRNLYRKHGRPFYVMRAPEYAPNKGAHLHLVICLPESLLSDLLAVLSHVTGSTHDVEAVFTSAERKNGHIARSACRGWLVQRNLRIGNGGEVGAADYLSKAMSRHSVEVQYRLTDELSALVKRYRAQKTAA